MRYLEDFEVGAVHELGTVTVTEREIVEFARKYDPQPFHVDTDLAGRSSFGGLIASGWLTASLFMRCYVDSLLRDAAGEGSPGIDELRYLRPVRPGDQLTARLTVLGIAPVITRPTVGVMRPRCEMVAADGAVVFSMVLHSLFLRRPAGVVRPEALEATELRS
ncbi:MAG: MaoC family dehydratase [Actinomycetota bacterium]|nr:MaoC family dehydratase [Actinomycetota bacterium]